ncbi:MAG: ATP-binding protein, partial [Chloroflexota bacterium]|nr:ATP-binding protein [Chloroflexota bacterium]
WWLAGRSVRPIQQSWERQHSFVANASHELRAPLTLLRASAEVTQRHLPTGDTRGRALLDDVLGECDHMARLVEDLLVLSKLDAGALTLRRERIEVPAFLADTGRRVGPLADARGVDLTVDADGGGAVWADPARLRQVVLILLDNALRHTPTGGRVRVEARPQGQVVHLVVVDTGAGIAPAHLPHLFERFYRVDAARGDGRNGDGGSGLGLAIAKALVEAQGGEVHLTSRLGAGTRVEVTLPTARADGSVPSSASRRTRRAQWRAQ